MAKILTLQVEDRDPISYKCADDKEVNSLISWYSTRRQDEIRVRVTVKDSN